MLYVKNFLFSAKNVINVNLYKVCILWYLRKALKSKLLLIEKGFLPSNYIVILL